MSALLSRTVVIALLLLLCNVDAFLSRQNNNSYRHHNRLFAANTAEPQKITVDLPPSNSGITATINIKPILSGESDFITVRYDVPFGLDVAPKKGLAVCTKDGPGGEKVNDVLRYTSCWKLGLPAGDGLLTTAAAFSGGLSWQCTMYDVMKAKAWEQVVEALTSNVQSRTDKVVMIFERPKGGSAPELE